jgi:hypothetical protein
MALRLLIVILFLLLRGEAGGSSARLVSSS